MSTHRHPFDQDWGVEMGEKCNLFDDLWLCVVLIMQFFPEGIGCHTHSDFVRAKIKQCEYPLEDHD